MARTTIRIVLLSTLCLTTGTLDAALGPSTTVWTAIAVDSKGDGRQPAGADTAQLSYQYDRLIDQLWLRLSLFGPPSSDAFTVDFAIDTGSDAPHTSWWGTNKDFTFDRLVSVRVNRQHGSYHAAAEIRQTQVPRAVPVVQREEIEVRLADNSILLGFKRATFLGASTNVHLIAAIKSETGLSDDIPKVRSAAIDLEEPRPRRGLREIDVSRNNLRFAHGQPLLADTAMPRIVERGRGPHTVILIPGVYSGAGVFDGFMARNDAAYRFLVLTPPGLDGTPPRALPDQGTSIGGFSWTQHLALDILDLIARRHLEKPIVVAHGFPGTLAAEALTVSHPHLLGGIIEVAPMPPQFFPAPSDPRRPATPAERVSVVDDSWAAFWFKYVTPETWESNNYPAEMFTSDPPRGKRVRQQVEATPLPVKIQYLMENMASDHSASLQRPGVPILALVPGFDEQLLTNPLFAWFKASFQDGWGPLRQSAQLEVTTIPSAGALLLDDQPTLADDAITRFVERQTRETPAPRESEFVVQQTRVFDGIRVWPKADVWVRRGHIEQIAPRIAAPAGIQMIDGQGQTLLPGLIDAHVHTWPTTLHEALVFGVTTVLDMFSDIHYSAQIKRQQAEGRALDLADLRSAGILVTAPKGHGTQFGIRIPTITAPDEAQAFVDARIAEGSDFIKLVYDDGETYGLNVPTLSKATMTAVISAAHHRHKLAVVHIGSLQGAKDAVLAGADGLVHLFVDRPSDEEFAALVAARHVFVVPTLSVLAAIAQVPAGHAVAADARLAAWLSPASLTNLERMYPRKSGNFQVPRDTVAQLNAHHVTILAGSDAPNPGTASGASLHGELELLVKSGLTPTEALASATSVTAATFKMHDRGRIAAGLRADLVLVKGDPTVDITATRDLVAVWKLGVPCDRTRTPLGITKQ